MGFWSSILLPLAVLWTIALVLVVVGVASCWTRQQCWQTSTLIQPFQQSQRAAEGLAHKVLLSADYLCRGVDFLCRRGWGLLGWLGVRHAALAQDVQAMQADLGGLTDCTEGSPDVPGRWPWVESVCTWATHAMA